jgi:hypothetical protein
MFYFLGTRCWEKIKWMAKKKKTDEMRHRMGTGGGPPLKLVYDPIIDQVEAIVPHLDITITETYDSDFHYLNKPSQSTEPLPSPSINQTPSTDNTASTSTFTSNSRHAFNNPSEPSLTSSAINTPQVIPSCTNDEITMTLPSTSSSLQTVLASLEAPQNLESNPVYPSSNGSLSPSRSYFLASPVPADQPCFSLKRSDKRPSPETLPSNKARRPGKKGGLSKAKLLVPNIKDNSSVSILSLVHDEFV